MYLLYVDESGDPGLYGSPSEYFALSGLVLHELRWKAVLDDLIQFRRQLRLDFTLKLREEFHSAHLINKPGDLVRIPRFRRLEMIRLFADRLASMDDLRIINVIVKKSSRYANQDIFNLAWTVLLQRFENTIERRNFPGPVDRDNRGLVISDHTNDKKLLSLLRKCRAYNPVSHTQDFGHGYRNIPFRYVIEDPIPRDSRHSYLIQAADLCAYLLYQFYSPNLFMRKKGGKTYFRRLEPVLCKVASSNNPFGIVELK